MSIIYDALKKVQKSGQEKILQQVTTQSAKVKTKINPMFIYLLVVCLGLVLGNFAYIFFSHPPKTNLPPQTINQAKPAPTLNPDISATPTPPPNPEPTLVLNGVFFEQGEGYALINNQILRVGDEVSNAKVKEIAITGVELEFEGKTIKLASPS